MKSVVIEKLSVSVNRIFWRYKMSARFYFHWLVLVCFFICFACKCYASPQKKIYIVTDLEGISGVYKFTQTRETDTPLAREAREYFMGDVAAVVRGLRDGGATEIIILDGHGNQAMIPHLMVSGAKYITGVPRPGGFCELDESFAGVVQLGAHAMMGTVDGVLHHTQSSKSENRYWYNGVESGELVQTALRAGHFGVPTIMVTGDEAACREAEKFFGKACVTVAVKKGLARESAMLYPFEETRKKLYSGARQAMKAIPKCKPYRIDMPIKAKKQHLVFEGTNNTSRLVTKEATVTNLFNIVNF